MSQHGYSDTFDAPRDVVEPPTPTLGMTITEPSTAAVARRCPSAEIIYVKLTALPQRMKSGEDGENDEKAKQAKANEIPALYVGVVLELTPLYGVLRPHGTTTKSDAVRDGLYLCNLSP